MPSLKCQRAMWRHRPQEEQVGPIPCDSTGIGRRVYGTRTVTTRSVSSTVSLIAFTAMALLALLEFFVYRDTWMKYEYDVDKDFS